jgi:hypothetical protein
MRETPEGHPGEEPLPNPEDRRTFLGRASTLAMVGGLAAGYGTLGYMAGRMKRYRIRVFPGDRVRIELSPYDLDRGRIVYRVS